MPPPVAYDPVPAWLRETRLRQRRDDGESWTQDDLRHRMDTEIGWAPHRPNYSKYENGRSKPNKATLARFLEFWAKLGEPGPDYTPPQAPEPPVDPVAKAISGLTAEMARWREKDRARIADLEQTVAGLAERLLAVERGASREQSAPHETAGSGR